MTERVGMKISSLSLIITLFKFVIGTDGFLVHGPAGPLTAQLRGAVLLPCFADRPLPLEELEVEWRRTDSDTIVHLFQKGQSRPESQGDTYRDRAHFFSQEIPKGNFSLLLENVRSTDSGVYRCVVYTDQENHDTLVEIREVERLVVTGTDEPVYGCAGEDVTLSCSVDTHVNVTELEVEWRKTDDDILVLLYADGENRPESQHARYLGRAEFFIEEIPKGNFSLKLSKVRTEDKGEFMCKVHSDTDSANTTVRIQALGFSSLHRFILVLSIAVTPVVLITGALSIRHFEKQSGRRGALWCHCLHVTVPSIMVSLAFILWGLTEGSTGEGVTCTVVSLLNILLLFYMAPYLISFSVVWRSIIVSIWIIGIPIIMTCTLTVSAIEFSTKYSSTTAEKAAFGTIIGGFTIMFGFFSVFQLLFYARWNNLFRERAGNMLHYILGIIGTLLLVITVSYITAVSVFMAKYGDAGWKAQVGRFINLLIVPLIMVLFPICIIVFWIICSLRRSEKLQLRHILCFWGYFMYQPILFNILFLAIYNQLLAWRHNAYIFGYSIPITVAALGIYACIYFWYYMALNDTAFKGFSHLVQKILLVTFFILHLILSFLYLNQILENDDGRPIKMCEYVFIYTLTVSSCFWDWQRDHLLVKPRKYVYLSAAFGLPLVNSVGLAAELILKADTGKQTLDLQMVVLISGSLLLFSQCIISLSAYCLDKKEKLKEIFVSLWRPQDPDPDQRSQEKHEMEVLSPADRSGLKRGETT